ncbi:hypothetical protein CC80DRAFT_17473 [Byssothecium circinans]|uniref:Uncharacterized protein n=1 Tax=Byssothecium circinans TaxID=147558 RepID=A0A6A5U179_9PLEO|nr:hypothetical protein CC80DRAFT_17473 [Byssothecium circinans]
MGKRVYSRFTNKKSIPSEPSNQKQRKYNVDTPKAPSHQTPSSENTARSKRRSKHFNGPVSLPFDIMDMEEAATPDHKQPRRESSDLSSQQSNKMDVNEAPADGASLSEAEKIRVAKLASRAFNRREYRDFLKPAPVETVDGNIINATSRQATLWSQNQAQSCLLTLPYNVRMRIYKLLFGNKTIVIDFQTYHLEGNMDNETAARVRPIFKYTRTALDYSSSRPVRRLPKNMQSAGITLLNRVCRQLWIETNDQPFIDNRVAFTSHNIMFNYIFMEKRLKSHQLAAITIIYVAEFLPGLAVLRMMPNLKRVELGGAGAHEDGLYWVERYGENPTLRKAATYLQRGYNGPRSGIPGGDIF